MKFGFTFANVGAEPARRWKFPAVSAESIDAFPEPLAHATFEPMAAVIHLAAWSARSDGNGLSIDAMRADCPTEIVASPEMAPCILQDKMPPLAELCVGMEEMIS